MKILKLVETFKGTKEEFQKIYNAMSLEKDIDIKASTFEKLYESESDYIYDFFIFYNKYVEEDDEEIEEEVIPPGGSNEQETKEEKVELKFD